MGKREDTIIAEAIASALLLGISISGPAWFQYRTTEAIERIRESPIGATLVEYFEEEGGSIELNNSLGSGLLWDNTVRVSSELAGRADYDVILIEEMYHLAQRERGLPLPEPETHIEVVKMILYISDELGGDASMDWRGCALMRTLAEPDTMEFWC